MATCDDFCQKLSHQDREFLFYKKYSEKYLFIVSYHLFQLDPRGAKNEKHDSLTIR